MSNYQEIKESEVNQLQQQYSISTLFAKLILGSDWSKEIIAEVLAGTKKPDHLNDPNLVKIKDRLLLAKQNKEKVFIAGDYDADGLCATAIMVRLLKQLDIEHGYYIPNRFSEGYGLNLTRTKQASEKGYTLFITVDNGISADEALEYCQENKIDVIILDHHEITQVVPYYALYHPSLAKGSASWLSGAGLAYTLSTLFPKVDQEPLVVLAMIAVISDMMEMRGDNRWIVLEGLNLLNRGIMPAILKLFPRVPEVISVDDIAFQVVPKLNAVGRLADRVDANKIVKYLTNDDLRFINQNYHSFEVINTQRKQLTNEMVKKINVNDLDPNFAVIFQPDFHLGIIGLVANRLVGELKRPVMVATENDGKIVASLRSPKTIDLIACLNPVKESFLSFGGHASAAGISIEPAKFSKLKTYLENYHYELTKSEDKIVKVDLSQLDPTSLAEVFAHGPYGKGVLLSKIYLEKPTVVKYSMLSKPNYLKWQFNSEFSGVSFSDKYTFTDFQGTNPSFIGDLRPNTFRSRTTYGLQITQVIK